MGAESLLTRMTPGSPKLEKVDPAHGAIKQSDVAGACQGMTQCEYAILTYKYGEDRKELRPVYFRLYDVAYKLAQREGWQVPEGRDYVARMVKLAVHDLCDPNVCVMCRGNGAIGHVHCEVCDGKGRKRPSDMDRARFIGMNRAGFSRIWKGRYEAIYQAGANIESRGLEKLARNMR